MYYQKYKIISIRGHYEVYKNGEFYCSADTKSEAIKEIEMDEED